VLSLFLLSRARAWSAEWLLGTLLATLGYFSVASGLLILPAATLLVLTTEQAEPGQRNLLSCAAAIWIFAVILGAGQKAVGNVIDEVSGSRCSWSWRWLRYRNPAVR
jgi:hypothetical protein